MVKDDICILNKVVNLARVKYSSSGLIYMVVFYMVKNVNQIVTLLNEIDTFIMIHMTMPTISK
jgi:hypothetical protein